LKSTKMPLLQCSDPQNGKNSRLLSSKIRTILNQYTVGLETHPA
jgi:hypothetical protein